MSTSIDSAFDLDDDAAAAACGDSCCPRLAEATDDFELLSAESAAEFGP